MAKPLYIKDGAYINYDGIGVPIWRDGKALKDGRWVDWKNQNSYVAWLLKNGFIWLRDDNEGTKTVYENT